jgi:hypothetical protein
LAGFAGDRGGRQFQMPPAAEDNDGGSNCRAGIVAEARDAVLADADDGQPAALV